MSEQVRPGVEVTERGNIYFFYRPAVGAETPQAWWTCSGSTSSSARRARTSSGC